MLLPAHNLSGYVSYINGEFPIHIGWAFILDTAFYPTPRSLGLLFNVVRPSYLSDIWYLSVCGIAPHLIQIYY